MKRLLFALCMLLPLPLPLLAQSPFDGTWKIQLDKADFSKKPDVYEVQNGMYRCDSCAPKIEIKADGQDQKVTGHPYYDTMAIKVVDDHAIEETDKRGDKVVLTQKYTVSSDDKTLTIDSVDSGQPSGDPVKFQTSYTRVGKAAAGNAVSGSWRIQKSEGSENGLLYSFKSEGDSLSYSTPTGKSYSAKVGGPEAPYVGDPGLTTVSLKRIGDNIEETDKRDGKTTYVAKMSVSSDGKTMNVVVDDKLHGRTDKFVATKQ
jgi:hypothetical protein